MLYEVITQDKYEVDGGYIKGLADIKYDLEYNEQKKAGKIREQSEMLEIVEEFSK